LLATHYGAVKAYLDASIAKALFASDVGD